MDFSDLSSYSGLACFSACGLLLACTEQHKLVVRDSETLSTRAIFACLDGITSIAFSPDSTLILAAQSKRRIAQVFSLEDPAWSCKIDEALAGLSSAQWAPDSRHVLTRCEFNLRLSIWSLSSKAVVHVKAPKLMPVVLDDHSPAPGQVSLPSEANGGGGCVKFAHSGQFMAVLLRREGRDVLSVYSTSSWALLKQFGVDTEDAVCMSWSPDDSAIALTDNAVAHRLVAYTPNGQKVLSYAPSDTSSLGLKPSATSWSPSGCFLAAGDYAGGLGVFTSSTGGLVTRLDHGDKALNAQGRATGGGMVVYAERALSGSGGSASFATPSASSASAGAAYEGDKENALMNPLDDDRGANFSSHNVSVLDATSPHDEDVLRSKAPLVKQAVRSGKQPAAPVGIAAKKAGAATGKPKPASAAAAAVKPVSILKKAPTPSAAALTSRSKAASAADSFAPAALNVPSRYVVADLPLSFVAHTPAVDKADPKIGVGLASWSMGDRFLLSRNDSHPNVAWVWDAQKLSVAAVLQQMDAVRAMAWDPKRLRFALCTASSKLFLWSPEGCSIVDVPLAAGQSFQVRRLEWSKEGNCILLMDKTKFCCCYLRE